MDGTALNTESRIQNWTEPQTLAEYAAASNGNAGVVCPGCGCQLFAYGTQTGKTRIIRYEACRNPSCNRRFKTRQEHREIIEEIEAKPPNISIAGKNAAKRHE